MRSAAAARWLCRKVAWSRARSYCQERSDGIQPPRHDVQAQRVMLLHVGLGLVGEHSRRTGEFQRDGLQRLTQVGCLEDACDGHAVLQSAEQRDIGA